MYQNPIDPETAIEYCHFSIQEFPNFHCRIGSHLLKSIVILAQDINAIGDLSPCINLENLWICETRVACIEPLATCRNLKNLRLYSNKITQMKPLEALEKLESLWINDNGMCMFNI